MSKKLSDIRFAQAHWDTEVRDPRYELRPAVALLRHMMTLASTGVPNANMQIQISRHVENRGLYACCPLGTAYRNPVACRLQFLQVAAAQPPRVENILAINRLTYGETPFSYSVDSYDLEHANSSNIEINGD